MRYVTLNRGSFDAFVRAYSTPSLPSDEVALMVGYGLRCKLNAVSAEPAMSDSQRRELTSLGGRPIRQLIDESVTLELTEEEYQLARRRFDEGRRTLSGWMEEEVWEALVSLRDAKKTEDGGGAVDRVGAGKPNGPART